MKRLASIILVLFVYINLNSQELPKIIPPSPNASAFHVYGNTQLNNYTGSPNITIPIWEVKEGDLSLPIYLKYTGGNGIKVEEIASWVGLGWTLNTGGAISRTIRGIADEDQTKTGFLNMTGIPIPNGSNLTEFDQIADGNKDGEPDKFMYNYPGGSGTFFYNYDNSIHFKPKKDILVSHTIGVESESVSNSNCLTYDEVITDFTLTDEYGKTYLYKDKERSNTIVFGHPTSDYRGFPSSWYLSKVENVSKTKAINLEYDAYSYSLMRSRSSIQIEGGIEDDIYTETSYIGKRLSKITFSNGSIEFVASSAYRKDFSNNKYLDQIIIKNNDNEIIKSFKFSYQYMTSSGLEDVTANLPDINENRLILTSIQECDGNNICKNPYTFTYETSQYLPSRFSKAIDHWGYYNGETSNTKLESKHFVTWFNPSLPGGGEWLTESVGSAVRTPNVNFSKVGVLKEIQYPTGGETIFEYESHTAVSDEISGILTQQTIMLMWQNQTTPFSVQLNSTTNPNTILKVSGFYSDPINQCIPEIYIKNLTTNQIDILSLDGVNYPQEVLLESGNYNAWFELESEIVNTCTQNNPASILLKWEDEDSSPTKLVGGIRIKSISDYSENDLLATKKNFNYNDDNGISSGRIVNAPKYYGLTYYRSISGSWTPLSYSRFVNSTIPLATTQGSHVGYGKLSVSKINDDNGKTEYYYTTTEDYPDIYNSINPSDGEPNFQVYDGVIIYPYPSPETDSKDFLRGLLKKQTDFKKSGSSFSKINETLYSYDTLKFSIGDLVNYDDEDIFKNAATAVRGLKVHEYSGGGQDFSYYDIYTGYNLPSKTITNAYTDTGVLQQVSIQDYDRDSNGIINHYIPISNEMNGSDGVNIKTNSTYIFNKVSLSSSEDALKNINALYLLIQTDTYKNGVLLKKSKVIYTDWGLNASGTANIIDKESIETSKGTNSLESRVVYHDYDHKGNPLEVSKSDGTRIVYIWGYSEQYPVAKIENATYTQVTAIFTPTELTNIKAGNYDDATMRAKLNNIRLSLTDSQVTTFTYDPLIGVTSITDPTGYTAYYNYDNFNRLQYIKNKDGDILEQNRYNYALEELVVNGTASPTSVTVGDNVTFIANVTGGSGNFTYEWTVSGVSNLPNANQISVTTISSHTPSFTATCLVTDVQTLESITFSKQVTVTQGYPALSVGDIYQPDVTKAVGNVVSYSITASGGSGSYNYKWTKTNNQYTITLANGSQSSIVDEVTPDDCDDFIIKCEVTDNVTNEIITKTKTMYVIFGCIGGWF